MSRSESSQLGPIDSQFDLYCMDYFDRFYNPSPHGYQRRYIRFEYQDTVEAHSDNLTSRFCLNPKVDFELVPFKAPECSSLKHHENYTTDGRFFMSLQFIDKDHLILRASLDLVFCGAQQDSQDPETFIFMSVRNDWGKQLQAAATDKRGRGEEAIDVQSKNYWDVEFSQEAIDCKSPIAVPIFARTDFANSVYCLALDERRGENGDIWYIRLGAFVITYAEDVPRFWEGIEEFDKHMPEECAKHDGLHRFKDLKWRKCTYVKMDEVLQRIIEIRALKF
ncbi:hypothetical protein FNAPI_8810 [Fusarium napiforme]|uniref:Uncharacterized protein n=1 Tax=Fusarium napiforme TaxID=42672 RepID=A0A8H5J0Y9_9HYPO|nr:hypothetical protein FNAPI_8810 [Fusarium napiforme]